MRTRVRGMPSFSSAWASRHVVVYPASEEIDSKKISKAVSTLLPFVGALQFPNTGGVLSVIWLVGLMNVVNFSDGVDGLAAGLCAIDGIASKRRRACSLSRLTASSQITSAASTSPAASNFSAANSAGFERGYAEAKSMAVA